MAGMTHPGGLRATHLDWCLHRGLSPEAPVEVQLADGTIVPVSEAEIIRRPDGVLVVRLTAGASEGG